MQCQVLLRLVLGLRGLLPKTRDVDVAQSVEDAEDVGDVVIINFVLEGLELIVRRVKPLDVILWVHEGLHHVDEPVAGHVVDEVEGDERDPELEVNVAEILLAELSLRNRGLLVSLT